MARVGGSVHGEGETAKKYSKTKNAYIAFTQRYTIF